MSRRGFALLAVLWVIATLAGLVGLGVGLMRIEAMASINRRRLERGRWGAEACLAIVGARWLDHRLEDSARVDLGRTLSCRWRVDDPGARLNVNTASIALLVSAGLPQAVADSVVAHRPFQDTSQVRQLLGSDSALLSLLTVDGPGTINVNRAPRAVLLALPGFGSETLERLAEHTRVGRPVSSLDQLVSAVSGERSALLAHYAELSSLITFAPAQLLITSAGEVGNEKPQATVEELVVPLPERLAVIRRRLW